MTIYEAERAGENAGRGALTTGALLVAFVAFGIYWLTAVLLDAREAAWHFGADSHHYAMLADMHVHHRAARFHPVTTALGLTWMKIFAPLTFWLAPATLLKAMFATVGALGVWAAMSAFAVLLPRGYALLGGILYASSLGVWYFSSIPESKIVTATLSVLYIAAYIRLRERWSVSGVIALSAILALACLNEIAAAFLLAIPVLDVLRARGLDWRHVRWLTAHAPAVLVAWVVLEVIVNGWLVPTSGDPEAKSHVSMFLFYLVKNDYGIATIHGFIANWFFFNLVAPTPYALQWPQAGGYFASTLLAYSASPLALSTLIVIAVIGAASLLPRYRAASLGPAGGLLLPLAAYALVRAVFFFIFNPTEALLFSPAVTIVHWLILLAPFAASRFPAKRRVLALLCLLLFATNAGFMLGPNGWSGFVGHFAGS
ncbi:MAG: hypothetical protein ACK4TL_06240 [Hyphomicrobiaceae bacterium]